MVHPVNIWLAENVFKEIIPEKFVAAEFKKSQGIFFREIRFDLK